MAYAFLFIIICLNTTQAQSQTYHWPMDADPALTSTFGEYRGGRLHAAIDLKTWGKEGFPVLSVADGYVWRVRTSPWGYGRVVYVHLKDGRFAVWAHLSGFSDAIEKYVHEEQDRRGTYSVNLYFRPDQLPVKAGDVVGFSGSTGIGVPHLHFELRDADHRPINPLTHGFDVKDTTPPTLLALGVVPRNASARVNGKVAPQAFALGWQEQKQQFVCADTLTIWGDVGLAVRVYDRADASLLTNKLAPYRLRLLVDGKEIFASTLEGFGYGVTHHGELDRNFMLSQRGLGRFQNLYRVPGNYLPFYGDYRIGDGVLHAGAKASRTGHVLSPGTYQVTVVAEDVKGNRAQAQVVVQVVALPEITELDVEWQDRSVTVQARLAHGQRAQFEVSKNGGKTWQGLSKWLPVTKQIKRTLERESGAVYRLRVLNAADQPAFMTFAEPKEVEPELVCETTYFPNFAHIQILSQVPLSLPPQVYIQTDMGQKTLFVRQTDVMQYEVNVPFEMRLSGDVLAQIQADGYSTSVLVKQQTIGKTQGGEIVSPDGLARVRFESDGVYEPLFGHIAVANEERFRDERMIGRVYHFKPDDVAFEKAEVILHYPEGVTDTSKVGIYEWDDRKGWVFVDIGRDSGLYAVNGEVKNLGIFALLIDDVPPEIAGLRPGNNQVIAERQPKILATIRDASSGIWREEDIDVRLDGQTLIVEYDPEEDLIFATPRQPLSVGTHTLEVIIRDICGNEARQVQSFVVE